MLDIGRVVETRRVAEASLDDSNFMVAIFDAFGRFLNGDWGDICEYDKKLNDRALNDGDDRIVAKYCIGASEIYIITECDHSYTTIMFCDEY